MLQRTQQRQAVCSCSGCKIVSEMTSVTAVVNHGVMRSFVISLLNKCLSKQHSVFLTRQSPWGCNHWGDLSSFFLHHPYHVTLLIVLVTCLLLGNTMKHHDHSKEGRFFWTNGSSVSVHDGKTKALAGSWGPDLKLRATNREHTRNAWGFENSETTLLKHFLQQGHNP